MAVKSKRPISYLTAGQNIPDDIEPASSAKLARMILGTELERVAGQPAAGQTATGQVARSVLGP
jgi:flagellar biosynthesis GTPase FlhF